ERLTAAVEHLERMLDEIGQEKSADRRRKDRGLLVDAAGGLHPEIQAAPVGQPRRERGPVLGGLGQCRARFRQVRLPRADETEPVDEVDLVQAQRAGAFANAAWRYQLLVETRQRGRDDVDV